MNATDIILLIIGVGIFIASFVVASKFEDLPEMTDEEAQRRLEEIYEKIQQKARECADEAVAESVKDSMDETERSLEKLSNEKIMAVSEYSDTVLDEIHRNHEEVMFMYDMLNDKHTNLKKTVSEVNRTMKAAEESQKEVEAADSFQKLAPETVETQESIGETKEPAVRESESEKADIQQEAADIGADDTSDSDMRNSNDKILELYRQGKSKVAIAQELGLGVGEVNLVIDLYRNK